MVTTVPGTPAEGENELIIGLTTKLVGLVARPEDVWTPIGPVCAPAGTVACRVASEITENEASTPPNRTRTVFVKSEPVTVTTWPGAPAAGMNEDTTGDGPAVSDRFST